MLVDHPAVRGSQNFCSPTHSIEVFDEGHAFDRGGRGIESARNWTFSSSGTSNGSRWNTLFQLVSTFPAGASSIRFRCRRAFARAMSTAAAVTRCASSAVRFGLAANPHVPLTRTRTPNPAFWVREIFRT